MNKLGPAAQVTLASLLLFGCGGGEGGSGSLIDTIVDVVTPAPSPAPTPAPTPDPTATPAPPPVTGPVVGSDTQEGFPQLAAIPTNFSISGMLQPSWGSGAIAAAQPAVEVVGAFRFLCRASHLAYDDPVVFPGQKGRSHLHMFFGNTAADANSTYESLRTTGGSTCNNALNRSAYWIPALMNGQGQVVLPEYISIYYKRAPQSDPVCQEGKGCIGLPRGLRYVFGRTMSGGNADSAYFNCDGPGAVPGHYRTLPEAAKNCPIGAKIGAIVSAPQCWDGQNLDSPDHRSHMSYLARDKNTGKEFCPATHPYRLPTFTIGAWYNTDATLDRSGDMSPAAKTWYFSSDRMAGMTHVTSGTSFHADWFGAWDDDAMKTWLANCIDKKLNCSGGDLGNGTQLSSSPEFVAARPHLIAAPPAPPGV